MLPEQILETKKFGTLFSCSGLITKVNQGLNAISLEETQNKTTETKDINNYQT